MNSCNPLDLKINWVKSNYGDYFFESIVNSKLAKLRLNDFPEENIATLFFDGHEFELETFPRNWSLPLKK